MLMRPPTNQTQHPCVVVGSGFSAVKLIDEIKDRSRRGEFIVALKSAHEFLLDHGIKIDAAIATDAQQSRAKCFRRPQKGTLYLCASQMHPDAWEHLRGFDVLIWNVLITKEQKNDPAWQDYLVIMGASTTGNAGIFLLHTLGFRNLHTYGIDSSIETPHWWNRWIPPKVKLDGTRTPRNHTLMQVEADGKRFWTTPEMILQANEIELMLNYIPGMKITAHGEGYYQSKIAEGRKAGWQI